MSSDQKAEKERALAWAQYLSERQSKSRRKALREAGLAEDPVNAVRQSDVTDGDGGIKIIFTPPPGLDSDEDGLDEA